MADFTFSYDTKVVVLADFRDKKGLQTSPPAGTVWAIEGIDGLVQAVAPDGSGATVVTAAPGTFTAMVKAPNADVTAPELTDTATVVMEPLPPTTVSVSAVAAQGDDGAPGVPGAEPATSVTVTAVPVEPGQ